MAVSEVSICSNALSMIGEKPITSLSDATARARLCNRWYEITRDALLEEHPWNFAIGRKSLNKLATDPVFEFDNAFQLPNDYLRVLATDPKDAIFTVESDSRLLTDESSIKIKYIKKITDPLVFSKNFVQALTARLALLFTNFITARGSLIDRIAAMEQQAIRRAKITDGQEQYPEIIQSDDLIDIRFTIETDRPEKDNLTHTVS